ncbi:MAG: DeoR/GlpR family DNA-binding transcription regulator [Rhodobacteraceae bacterium]|nr:DeoR/GlpR family DNA-binding transcription regulator [Paracoccaceae bacterium]
MHATPLRSNHREQEILKELRLSGGSCRVGVLAKRLGVSEETVRRNIKVLQAKSLVRKVHGGVLLAKDLTLTEPPFQARMDKNASAKRLLAARLAEMISDGDSLFLDIGSSTAYAAQALRNHRNLYIVTNSLTVAGILATRNNNRVFFAGGELRNHDGGSFGQDARAFIRRFNVQYAVLSVGAINAQIGFMLHDIQEADLSQQAAARAQTCIVLADSSKFERRAPIGVADQSRIDILITESQPSEPIIQMLARNDISLALATTQS